MTNALENRNVDWKLIITPGEDGVIPREQVTNALLLDIREAARSIRRMAMFFTISVIIGCVGIVLWYMVDEVARTR